MLDTHVRHLRSRVSATGHRSFTTMLNAVKLDDEGNVILNDKGKPVRTPQRFTYRDPITGQIIYGKQQLTAARQWALQLKLDTEVDKHPKLEMLAKAAERDGQQADAERLKLKNLIPLYIERSAKQTQRRWRDTEALLRRHLLKQERKREKGKTVGWRDTKFQGWRETSVTSVTHAEVADLLWEVEEKTGLHTRNRLLAAVSGFLRWCMEDRRVIKAWPLGKKLSRKEKPSEEVLEPSMLRAIWHAAGDLGYPFGTAIRMLMVTAQRRSEVIEAPLAEFEPARWVIPASRNKGKRTHIVPLTPTSLALLGEARKQCDELRKNFGTDFGLHVFTRRRERAKSPLSGKVPIGAIGKNKVELDKLVARHLKVDEVSWRIHSLRRTAAENMEKKLGIPFTTIGALLNHSPSAMKGITARYLPGDAWDDKMDAALAWDRLLALIVDAKAWRKVEPILEATDRNLRPARQELRAMIVGTDQQWGKYLKRLLGEKKTPQRSAKGSRVEMGASAR